MKRTLPSCLANQSAKPRFCSAGFRWCRSFLGGRAWALRSVGVQTGEQRPEQLRSAAHRGSRGEQEDAQGGVQVTKRGVRVGTEQAFLSEQTCLQRLAIIFFSFLNLSSVLYESRSGRGTNRRARGLIRKRGSVFGHFDPDILLVKTLYILQSIQQLFLVF